MGSFSDRPRTVNHVSVVFSHILESNFFWQAQYFVSPPNVNDVSCVATNQVHTDFSWQRQYLVKLEGASCCSARCK